MALNSTSVIKIVDLLCEGPIVGFTDVDQNVFLDETPIQTGSSRNFPAQDVSFDFRLGGRTQTFLTQAGDSSSTVSQIDTEIGQNYSETLDGNNQVTARDYGAGQIILLKYYSQFRVFFLQHKKV